MHASLLTAFVPAEVMVPVCEVDVLFVEDGTPLKRGSCISQHTRMSASVSQSEKQFIERCVMKRGETEDVGACKVVIS